MLIEKPIDLRELAGAHDPDDIQVVMAPARRRPQRRRVPVKVALALVDLVVLAAAMVLAFQLRTLLPSPADHEARHLVVGVLSLPVGLFLFVHYELYRANKVIARRDEVGRLIHATAGWVLCMALLGFILQLYVARGWLALTFLIALPMLMVEREIVRRRFAGMRRHGKLLRRVVIVGHNADAVALGAALMANPKLGYKVVAFVDDDSPAGDHFVDHRSVSGSVNRTLDAVTTNGAQGVIVVATAVGMAAANRLVRDLLEKGISVEVISALRDIAVERLSLRELGGFPVVHVERVRREGWRATAKRAFDVGASGAGLILGAPVLVVVALAVKLSSPGPILFRQARVGREGEIFEILKFRTMAIDAEEKLKELLELNEGAGPLFKIKHDPRITPVGRFLRRFSLDEVPQLWNVLLGDMSLVGPRPALAHELSAWSPELHQRLRVRPGITGMWQVCGRSSASFEDYSRLDLYYVDNWSLLVDLTILARTIPAVVSARGAY